ncbi:hypothetical protein MMPV_006021 [Pyropia vietnamensis]
MAAFVSAFAGRSLLSAPHRRAAVVVAPPTPGAAVAQLQKPPPRPSPNPPPPRPSSGGTNDNNNDNNNNDGPGSLGGAVPPAAASTPPVAPASAPAPAAPHGNGTAAQLEGPPRSPPSSQRAGGGGGGAERPARREGGPRRLEGGGGPRGGGSPIHTSGGYRTSTARARPDAAGSPRAAPSSAGRARGGGGGGARTGYSSERGRASREASGERGPPRDRTLRTVGGIQYTTCSNCKATYVMTPESLTAGGGTGAKVRCAVCKYVWFQSADRLSVLAPGMGMKDYPKDRKEEFAAGGDSRQEGTPISNRPVRGGPAGDRREGSGGERGSYGSRGGASGGNRRSFGGNGDRRGSSRSFSKTTVFVGNLPFAASEAQLRELLTSTGAGVGKVTIVSDQNGRPKGFAFAEMASEADMRSVVDGLNGSTLGGRNVSIREGNNN